MLSLHPALILLACLVGGLIVILSLSLIATLTDGSDGDTLPDRDAPPPSDRPAAYTYDEKGRLRVPLGGGLTMHMPRELQLELGWRLPMHSRFVPDEATSHTRAEAMADQILADQAKAHEEPGKLVDVPAPGEDGYRLPSDYIPVSVGPYTVHLLRQSRTTVSEARPDGAEWPQADVPEEWEPVVVAFAMEVLRLREGWQHPSTAPAYHQHHTGD